MTSRWLACVAVPELPLQILLNERGIGGSGRRSIPCAVVDEDRPEGVILHVNRAARVQGVLPGMRYAAGQALAAELQAGVVEPQKVQAAVDAIAAEVRAFSPEVEPSHDVAGLFWLDATGLRRLYGAPEPWAESLRQRLRRPGPQRLGWVAGIAVGWQRTALALLATVAMSTAGRTMVFRTRQREAQARDAVPLALVPPGLGLDPATRDALHKIGIDTVGELLALPREGLRERYGETAYQFHRTLHGATEAPLRPQVPVSPPRAVHDLEPPDDDSERLLFVARALLHPLLAESARRHEAVAALHLELQLELPKHAPRPVDAPGEPAPKPVVRERLQPAEATLQETLLVDLVRMRLQTLTLPARVERVAVELATVAASAAQLRLWQLAGRRDPEAVAGALARLRAAFGEGAVVRFKLRAAHLPEARFAGEPVAVLPEFEPPAPLLDTPRLDASDVPDPPPRLVRRMLPRATPLPARPKHEPDGWLLSDWRQGSVVRLWGPFRVTGGWWVREVRRDYHYVETESGELLWVYWDGVRRGWNLQGVVD